MDLTVEVFRQALNQDFVVHLDSGAVYPMTLVEVNDLGEPGAPGLPRPFTLLFRNADRQHYLPQRTYRLENTLLGSLEIFLVPLGPDTQGMRYEAVFG